MDREACPTGGAGDGEGARLLFEAQSRAAGGAGGVDVATVGEEAGKEALYAAHGCEDDAKKQLVFAAASRNVVREDAEGGVCRDETGDADEDEAFKDGAEDGE